jgi:ribosomal protein S18 acetylase RimI-like enzyme
VIRTATDADAALVRELLREFDAEVPDLPWRPPDDDEPYDFALLADEAGVATVRRLGPRLWFLDVLYVRAAERNRGLGRALLRAVAEQARDEGVEMIELEVLESNDRARSLYESLGFATVERQLAVSVERLAAAHAVGPTYGAVHVQTDDADLVRRNAAKVLHAEPEVKAGNGWIRVEADADKLRNLARELSFTTGVSLSLSVEDGAVVRYVLFDRGSMVDEYLSVPEFHGPLPPGDVYALGANPTVVARLTNADPHRVREVARTAASPDELPPADDLYREIADVLGVEVN